MILDPDALIREISYLARSNAVPPWVRNRLKHVLTAVLVLLERPETNGGETECGPS